MQNLPSVVILVLGAIYIVLSPVTTDEVWFSGHALVVAQFEQFFRALISVLLALSLVKYLRSDI